MKVDSMPLPAIGAAATRAGAAAGRRARISLMKGGGLPSVSFDNIFSIEGIMMRIFSIEGIMMLTLAVIIDLLGLLDLIPIVGNILAFLIDIPAIIFIGGWILFFKQKWPQIPGRTATRFAKGKIGKWIIRILASVGETIPGVGLLPLWTLLVFIELITD